MKKFKKRQTSHKRKRTISKNVICEQEVLDCERKSTLDLRKTKTQKSLEMPQSSLKCLTKYCNVPSENFDESRNEKYDHSLSTGADLQNTIFVSLEIVEESRRRNQKCKSLSNHLRKIASCHKKYREKKYKPRKPRSSISFSKAFGNKKSQLIKGFRKIPKQYKQLLSGTKQNPPLGRHPDNKLTRGKDHKRRMETYEKRSSGDGNVDKIDQPRRTTNSLKFFHELPKNYKDLWPTFTLQMPENDVSKVDKNFLKSIINLANGSGKIDTKFLLQLDNQKLLSNNLGGKIKKTLAEEQAELRIPDKKNRGENRENLSNSNHTLIKVKITEKENKLQEAVKTTVDITSSIERSMKQDDEEDNRKRLRNIRKSVKLSESIKRDVDEFEKKNIVNKKLRSLCHSTDSIKISKKQKLKRKDLKAEAQTEKKIKELWRREEEQASSDFSLSSQSSQTNVDYTYLGMKSYRALKQIVEKEVQRISKNYVIEKNQKSNCEADSTGNQDDEKLKLSEKKIQSKKAKKKVVTSNPIDAPPTEINETSKSSCQEDTKTKEDIMDKKKPDAILTVEESKKINLQPTSNSKIANEIIKNWSILHRLEKAFLALGTPKFSNQSFRNFDSHRKKELPESCRGVSQSSSKREQAIKSPASKQQLNSTEPKLNSAKPKRSQESNCGEFGGGKKENSKNQNQRSDEKNFKKFTPLGLFEESLIKKNKTDLRSIPLRERSSSCRKELEPELYNSFFIGARPQSRFESKSGSREKKPILTRQTKSPRTNFQYNINTIKKKSKCMLKQRDYSLESECIKDEDKKSKVKPGEIVKRERDMSDKSCKGDDKIEAKKSNISTTTKLMGEEKYDKISVKDFKGVTPTKYAYNPHLQKLRKPAAPETGEIPTENRTSISLKITAKERNQKLMNWLTDRMGNNNILPKESQETEIEKQSSSLSVKKNYNSSKQTESESGMENSRKCSKATIEDSGTDYTVDKNNNRNSEKYQQSGKAQQRVVKERSILSLLQHSSEHQPSIKTTNEDAESKSISPDDWKVVESSPERNCKYQNYSEMNEKENFHLNHSLGSSTSTKSKSYNVEEFSGQGSAADFKKLVQKNNAHSLGSLKGATIQVYDDVIKQISDYGKEGRHQWERDINTYREIVREIIGQYQRINGLLKQNKDVPQDYESELSNEKLRDEKQYPVNLKEYRKKIISEYRAVPIFEYKSRMLENEAKKSGNTEYSMPRNLLVVKDLSTEADLDVKDFQPNMHHVLDSQLYVDKKDVLRRRMNVKGMEKFSSLQEAVFRPGKMAEEGAKKNGESPKTVSTQKTISSAAETMDSEMLSSTSTYQDDFRSDSLVSSSDFDQNSSDPSFPESTIFYLTSLSECFI